MGNACQIKMFTNQSEIILYLKIKVVIFFLIFRILYKSPCLNLKRGKNETKEFIT